MNNWYKIAKDFTERNMVNDKIRYLRDIKQTLNNISKVIFHSAKFAKNVNYDIVTSKKITSYPNIQDILSRESVFHHLQARIS